MSGARHETEVTTTIRWSPEYQDEDGNWHGHDVLDSIIEAAGRQLLAQLHGQIETASIMAANALREKVDAHIAGLLDEALKRTLTPTNEYGVPRGEPRPFEDIVLERVDQYLRSASSDSFSGRTSLVGQKLNAEVAKVVKGELSGALSAAVAEIRRAVEAEGARMLAETLAKLRQEVR